MKKTVLIILTLLLFLSSCTVQETVDPNVFVARLESKGSFAPDYETMHYDNRICALFLDYKSDFRVAAEMTLTENSAVSSVAVCGKGDKTVVFADLSAEIISVYAPEENSEEIIGNLFSDGYSYYETDWYSYSTYCDAETVYFRIENNKLIERETPELTLKAQTTAKN